MQNVQITHYATLEANDKFIVKIGSRFKLVWDDRRNVSNRTHFTKVFETQGGADAYIAQYQKIKQPEVTK